MNPGDSVTILPPFEAFFPGTFTIAAVDGTTAWLTDSAGAAVESAFDFIYLQKASA